MSADIALAARVSPRESLQCPLGPYSFGTDIGHSWHGWVGARRNGNPTTFGCALDLSSVTWSFAKGYKKGGELGQNWAVPQCRTQLPLVRMQLRQAPGAGHYSHPTSLGRNLQGGAAKQCQGIRNFRGAPEIR